MSWYKRAKLASWLKKASITFSLNDAYKIAQPKNMSDLSRDMMNFMHYKNNTYKPGFNDISPDGDDYDKFEGTINVYVPQGTSTEEVKKAILAYIEDIQVEGYKMSIKLDTSNLTNSYVFRVNVSENPTKNLPQIPDINMANGNAAAIMRLVGLDDSSGSIGLNDLKKRIIAVSQEEMKKEVIEPGHINPNVDFDIMGGEVKHDPADWWKKPEPPTVPNDPNPGKVQIMTGGRDEGYIDGRLQELYSLVDFGLQHGFKSVVWG